jgi:hypothetical protein
VSMLRRGHQCGISIFAATTTYTIINIHILSLKYHSRSGNLSVPEEHRRKLLL